MLPFTLIDDQSSKINTPTTAPNITESIVPLLNIKRIVETLQTENASFDITEFR